METSTITALVAIGSIIFIGFFGNVVFQKYRIPDILLLILLGILIGPDVLGNRFGLVTNESLADINEFKDLFLSAALIIILFDGGLSLDIRTVFESMRLSLFMAVVTLIIEMLVIGSLFVLVMNMDFFIGMILGAVVGGTTGAMVIPVANRMRIRPQTKATLIMESVITDVVVIVAALTLISIVKIGEFNLWLVTKDLVFKFLVGAVVGGVAGVAWLFVLDRLHNQPLSYMITVAALFIVAAIVEVPPISSSGAVAALAFGLALGNRRFVKRRLTALSLAALNDEHIHHFHTEITFFVRTFFFVYLGLSFALGTFTEVHLISGTLLIAVIILIRQITSTIAARMGDLEDDDARALFALMPRGLAAAVLATLPASELSGSPLWRYEYGELFLNSVLLVIIGTTIVATILSFRIEKNIERKHRKELRKSLTEYS